MENKIRVLRVSSDPGERAALRRLLAHTSWQLYEACSVEAAREMFSTQAVDVVLCDECLRDGTWRDVLKDAPGDAETIVISRSPDDRLWSEVLNRGAYDLLTFGRDAELFRVIAAAWRHARYGPKTQAKAS